MHPLVEQLKFTRSEFMRVFEGVSDEDAMQRLLPMNCLSWIIAHLAMQEQSYWVRLAQGEDTVPHPELAEVVGFPDTATTPELALSRTIWADVTRKADEFLDTIEEPMLTEFFELDGKPVRESIGTMMHRNIYHYWYHTGEAHAIRQQLGHTDLPSFVGDMSAVNYRSEG